MVQFRLARDRDASFVIRGFRFQIDLTLLQWLNLESDQHLELECGEDIDVVVHALHEPSDELARELQQIKHRDKNLTLRSEAVRSAIANAVEHRSHNPDLPLTIRFVTNSSPGKEQPSPFAGKTPGIRVWEGIRKAEYDADEQSENLAHIRSILRHARKPRDFNAGTWDTFVSFCESATDEQILDLIRHFEWSMAQPDAEETASMVCALLVEKGHSPSRSQATELHARLFLRVIKLLSQPGRKQLGLADLDELTQLPPLSGPDQTLLNVITAEVFRVVARLDDVEQRLAGHDDAIEAVQAQLRQQVEGEGITGDVTAQLPDVSTEPPPKVTLLCQRTSSVESLIQATRNHTWTGIVGSVGTGKTQLAGLLADAVAGTPVHIQLRGLEPTQALFRIHKVCSQLADEDFQASQATVVRMACRQLPGDALFLIDDLPQLTGEDDLSQILIALAQACQENSIGIVSTSHFDLPRRIRESLPRQCVLSVPTPPFSDDEAQELFTLHGAPKTFCESQLPTVINALVQGHATLLVAYAESLAAQQWTIDSEERARLHDAESAREVIEETVRRLLRTVGDDSTRNLLYRLGLIIDAFGMPEVEVATNAPPVIERPQERLSALMGLWLERRPQQRIAVSPLVKPMSSSELTAEVRQDVLRRLGRHVAGRRPLSVVDVVEASIYLFRAADYDWLGRFLAVALGSSDALPTPQVKHLAAMCWTADALPSEMDIGVRIVLRAQQARVWHRLGRNVDELLRDLNALINGSRPEDRWAAYSASVISLWTIGSVPFEDALVFVERAVDFPDDDKQFEPMASAAEDARSGAVWFAVSGIETSDDLESWLGLLDRIGEHALGQAFASEMAPEGALMAVDRAWTREHQKAEHERDWNDVLSVYASARQFSEQNDIELLWAAALRAEIIVRAEYMDDIDVAIQSVESALSHPLLGPRSRLLLCDSIGRQLVYKNRPVDALPWFEQALDVDIDAFPSVRVGTRLLAARAIGDTDNARALVLSEEAVDLARAHSFHISELEFATALGEWGVARCLAGDWTGSFEPFNEAAKTFFACQDSTDVWKQRFVSFAHVVGYATSMAASGTPPKETADGQEQAAPMHACIVLANEQLAERYDEQNYDVSGLPILGAILSTFAAAAGNDQECVAWAFRAIDAAREVGMLEPVATLAGSVLPVLLNDGRIAEAVDIANENSVALIATRVASDRDGSKLTTGVQATDVLGDKPNSHWDEVEQHAVIYGVLPTIMHIGRVRLNDEDKALAYAETLVATCLEVADSASNRELWRNAADCVSSIFVTPLPLQDMIDRASQAAERNDSILHRGYNLAMTLIPQARVEAAPVFHAMEFELWLRESAYRQPVYRQIALPFLEKYWRHTFQQQRFRFSSPQVTESRLEAACSQPEDIRAQSILNAVFTGFALRIPDNLTHVRDWLAGAVE